MTDEKKNGQLAAPEPGRAAAHAGLGKAGTRGMLTRRHASMQVLACCELRCSTVQKRAEAQDEVPDGRC